MKNILPIALLSYVDYYRMYKKSLLNKDKNYLMKNEKRVNEKYWVCTKPKRRKTKIIVVVNRTGVYMNVCLFNVCKYVVGTHIAIESQSI